MTRCLLTYSIKALKKTVLALLHIEKNNMLNITANC